MILSQRISPARTAYLYEVGKVSSVRLVQPIALITVRIHLVLSSIQLCRLVIARRDFRWVFWHERDLRGSPAHVQGSQSLVLIG